MSESLLTPHRKKQLKELEEKLQTAFLNESLLNQSLTHSSYAYEKRHEGAADNERMEFLGDAVLKIVISEHLIHKYPTYAEGELTKIRANVVSDVTLSACAQKLDLGSYLLLGANESQTGGIHRRSNLANALEALFAAVYLDAGIGKSRELILHLLAHDLDRVSQEGFIEDYKSALQELVQKKKWGLPYYKVTKEVGPKHKRIFWIQVLIKGKVFGSGKGLSKKEAEQAAACEALDKFKRAKRTTKEE